jgi:hypothetical protein
MVALSPNSPSTNPSSSWHRIVARLAKPRGHDIGAHQTERGVAVLMPSEAIPQAHHEGANQFVSSVDRIKLRQLATHSASTILIGDTPTAGMAMLPRNRVRTSWNGTGQR